MIGGPEAFSPIVERYQDALFGIALARVRHFHEAEDIAQSAFVEAFERLDSLKDPARLGAWLRSITMHIAIDRVRRRREIAEIGEESMPPAKGATPHEQLERNELRERVLAAIGQPQQDTARDHDAVLHQWLFARRRGGDTGSAGRHGEAPGRDGHTSLPGRLLPPPARTPMRDPCRQHVIHSISYVKSHLKSATAGL